MRVKIYSCSNDPMLFVVMPASSSTESLPGQVKSVTGDLSLFKELELSKDKPRAALNVEMAFADIDKNGYHLTKVKIRIEEKTRRKK